MVNPTQAWFYFNRGLANLNAGRFQATIPDFTRAIELRADFTTAYALRSVAESRLGKPEDAEEGFPDSGQYRSRQAEVIKDMASRSGVKL